MILQPDKALRRAVGIHEFTDLLPVEHHSNGTSLSRDLIGVPLAQRLGGQVGRRCKLVDRPGEMERIAKSVRVYVRVLTGIVDLNFVTLVYCDLPVICRIGIAESRETDE